MSYKRLSIKEHPEEAKAMENSRSNTRKGIAMAMAAPVQVIAVIPDAWKGYSAQHPNSTSISVIKNTPDTAYIRGAPLLIAMKALFNFLSMTTQQTVANTSSYLRGSKENEPENIDQLIGVLTSAVIAAMTFGGIEGFKHLRQMGYTWKAIKAMGLLHILFKGFGLKYIRELSYVAALSTLTDRVKHVVSMSQPSLDPVKADIVSGLITGAAVGITSAPTDTYLTRYLRNQVFPKTNVEMLREVGKNYHHMFNGFTRPSPTGPVAKAIETLSNVAPQSRLIQHLTKRPKASNSAVAIRRFATFQALFFISSVLSVRAGASITTPIVDDPSRSAIKLKKITKKQSLRIGRAIIPINATRGGHLGPAPKLAIQRLSQYLIRRLGY